MLNKMCPNKSVFQLPLQHKGRSDCLCALGGRLEDAFQEERTSKQVLKDALN